MTEREFAEFMARLANIRVAGYWGPWTKAEMGIQSAQLKPRLIAAPAAVANKVLSRMAQDSGDGGIVLGELCIAIHGMIRPPQAATPDGPPATPEEWAQAAERLQDMGIATRGIGHRDDDQRASPDERRRQLEKQVRAIERQG